MALDRRHVDSKETVERIVPSQMKNPSLQQLVYWAFLCLLAVVVIPPTLFYFRLRQTCTYGGTQLVIELMEKKIFSALHQEPSSTLMERERYIWTLMKRARLANSQLKSAFGAFNNEGSTIENSEIVTLVLFGDTQKYCGAETVWTDHSRLRVKLDDQELQLLESKTTFADADADGLLEIVQRGASPIPFTFDDCGKVLLKATE